MPVIWKLQFIVRNCHTNSGNRGGSAFLGSVRLLNRLNRLGSCEAGSNGSVPVVSRFQKMQTVSMKTDENRGSHGSVLANFQKGAQSRYEFAIHTLLGQHQSWIKFRHNKACLSTYTIGTQNFFPPWEFSAKFSHRPPFHAHGALQVSHAQ